MAKVTLKRIDVFSFLKWQVLLSLITGFFVGAIYTAYAYLLASTDGRKEILSYLFWYALGTPVFYVLVTLLSCSIGALLYNALSSTFGGMQFEVESEADDLVEPPSPLEKWQ